MTLRMHALLIESLELRQLFAAGFQIDMVSDASVSASVKSVLQQAVAKWQSIITGDIPDVPAGAWGAAVDDIRITASVVAIDGPGKGLAQAKPTFIRSGSHLPIAGVIQIDSADVGNSALLSTVTHEIAHALGFGTIWSQFAGLTSGIGGSNSLFLGANALREYRTYANNSSLAGVPLENTGGAGTRDAHWRETTFGNELLTGFLGAGANPLSRITIGSMADLGYQVNYGAADSYTLPGTVTPPTKGSISGKVFTDKNGDKVFETGEAGVANRAVYIDLNNNSVRDSNETELFTDANGNYTFSGLSAGTYKVRIVRDGLTQTFPANNFGIGVTLSAGQNVTGQNFATVGGTVTPPTTGSISGKVFTDKNGDKIFETGEAGVANRAVYIDLNNNSARDSNETEVFTDSSGNYTLSGLSAGTYKVRIVRDGLTQTFPANNFGIGVTLAASQNVIGENFATIGATSGTPPTSSTGNITGKVFNDANKNGSLDSGETGGWSGRKVYLDLNKDTFYESGEPFATTDSNGNFTFSSVAIGSYNLRLYRGDLTQTTPAGNGFISVSVTAGGTASGKNFGAYITPASVMTLDAWTALTSKHRDTDIDSIV